MTSAVAVVGLTFDSHDLADIDGIFLDLYKGGPGETAEVRGRDDVIPAAVGLLARNRVKQRRVIELRGFVRGTGSDETAQRTDYWDNRQTLEGWFDPTATANLVATLPGGAEFTIAARPLPGIVYGQVVPSFATVSIVLESVDPDWTETGS